jgi:iron complex outermembrane receptor protein
LNSQEDERERKYIMNRIRFIRNSSAALALGLSFAGTVQAQTREPDANDIIVTARKRSEALSQVPLAVTAVNQEILQNSFVTRVQDLQKLAPGVTISASTTSSNALAPFIRGIGTRSAEPTQDLPIAISVDGVYLAAVSGSAIIDTFDVAQVEILRGPQGTLEGRNSPGGAVNFTTIRPNGEFHAQAEASYASFNELRLRAAVEAPLVQDVLSIRISGSFNRGGGYLKSLTTGARWGDKRSWGGRIGLLYTPDDAMTVYLTADYTNDESQGSPLRPVPTNVAYPRQRVPRVCNGTNPATGLPFGYCTPYPEYRNGAEYDVRPENHVGGFALNMDRDLGGVSLTSITGYRFANLHEEADLDALPAAIIETRGRFLKNRLFSQELRLASDNSSPLEWVVGGFYGRSTFNLVREPIWINGVQPTFAATRSGSQIARSYAAFAHGIYKITDKLSVSVGGRKTWDEKEQVTKPSGLAVPRRFAAKFDNFSMEAGIDYKIGDHGTVYARYSEGYRSGGINSGLASRTQADPFGPETAATYEVGLKSRLPGNYGSFSLAAYHTKYNDLQQVTTVFENSSTVRLIRNAAGVKIKGTYTDASYSSFFADLLGTGTAADFSFLTLPLVSKWTGYLGADYNVPLGSGSLTINGNLEYRSHSNVSGPLQTQIGDQPGYALLGASITYTSPDERFSISVFGRNLTDKYYNTGAEDINGQVQFVNPARPRSVGVRLTGKI